jgi:hypothetical protein
MVFLKLSNLEVLFDVGGTMRVPNLAKYLRLLVFEWKWEYSTNTY